MWKYGNVQMCKVENVKINGIQVFVFILKMELNFEGPAFTVVCFD